MKKAPLWIVASVFALASLVFMGHGARAAGSMDARVATQAGTVQGRVEAGLLTFEGVPCAAP